MKVLGKHAGFSIVEIVIVFAVIGLVGFISYIAFNRMQDNNATRTSQTSAPPPAISNVGPVPSINSASDLDTVQKILDQTDPSGSNGADATQLNSELTAF